MIINDLIKVICINEPDISYTRNKPLVVNKKYFAKYEEVKLQSYGSCPVYKVFDDGKNLLGEYYARDFKTLEENRDSILDEILT
jgi:hypothetical protein